MAQYRGREESFNGSLPGIVSGFMVAIAEGDADARMRNIELLQAVMEMDDVSLEAKISILNREDPAVFALTTPALMHAELGPFLAESVEYDMSMSVHASTVTEKGVDSETTTDAKASGGGLFAKASIGIKATVSTHSNKKRASDYSATTDMRMRMSRHPIPEGTSRMLDSMLSFVDSFNQVNIDLGKAEAARIAGEGPELPPPSEEKDEPESTPATAPAGGNKPAGGGAQKGGPAV